MYDLNSYRRRLSWCATALFALAAAGCNGDSILGAADRVATAPIAPVVTTVSPINNAIGVAVGSTVAITFDKPMATGSTFVITCAAPCVNPTGTVALSAGGTIATYTLTPSTSFAPLTLYTVTANAPMSAGGLPLVTPFVSSFVTAGTTADTVRPRVLSTTPVTTSPGPTLGVPTNASVAAVFSKDMNQASIEARARHFHGDLRNSLRIPDRRSELLGWQQDCGLCPVGAPRYCHDVHGEHQHRGNGSCRQRAGRQSGRPARGKCLRWTFTTAAAAAAGAITVLSTSPLAAATGVCPSATVNATFAVPSGLRLDPADRQRDQLHRRRTRTRARPGDRGNHRCRQRHRPDRDLHTGGSARGQHQLLGHARRRRHRRQGPRDSRERDGGEFHLDIHHRRLHLRDAAGDPAQLRSRLSARSAAPPA